MTTLTKALPTHLEETRIDSEKLRTVLMLCAATAFGFMLHASYGLDLSYAFF
ncbi:conserved exported hypothetical protein [Bradyrhizobium sp. ORS 375]|uniref:hypothetical protein n=1 Tax=Bradyrhizobium sp. (strain ORS 375) TaxID=566679 RepID=UPI000240AD7B|nr:hypothetical protein [Bradyrhizobium sp. ORS 375]CCD94085.1 conserved exported hypothetical protein [Bradyrhizobium sp. ORS 375]